MALQGSGRFQGLAEDFLGGGGGRQDYSQIVRTLSDQYSRRRGSGAGANVNSAGMMVAGTPVPPAPLPQKTLGGLGLQAHYSSEDTTGTPTTSFPTKTPPDTTTPPSGGNLAPDVGAFTRTPGGQQVLSTLSAQRSRSVGGRGDLRQRQLSQNPNFVGPGARDDRSAFRQRSLPTPGQGRFPVNVGGIPEASVTPPPTPIYGAGAGQPGQITLNQMNPSELSELATAMSQLGETAIAAQIALLLQGQGSAIGDTFLSDYARFFGSQAIS